MAISAEVALMLPELKLFAKALSGVQNGDRHVVTLLERLAADGAGLDRDLPPRVALYRAFLATWRNDMAARGLTPPGNAAGGTEPIASLAAVPRQAFLLVAMAGFTTGEAAQVLDTSPAVVTRLIGAAGQQIAVRSAVDVLIIEDEPLIAMDLEQIVTDLGHHVRAVARTEAEALAVATALKPGLVLADVNLAEGGSGLTAAREIVARLGVPAIFITAYPERLLGGERPQPSLLITKPFAPERVKAAIDQALLLDGRSAA